MTTVETAILDIARRRKMPFWVADGGFVRPERAEAAGNHRSLTAKHPQRCRDRILQRICPLPRRCRVMPREAAAHRAPNA
ncbi:hypothetical protein MKK70_19820 [Methylobacterium sp. E-041]|uniref:hypothetical protein n=1 Tax=Methylobacterium sp. E-041 TaxID=2836573 RepID=UPI001FBB3E83|nr:hypothetical protein [Methylobacterium sp. E-041]MCJ2107583.1 hypothetical protein [Methylobacterium sp. E-041]